MRKIESKDLAYDQIAHEWLKCIDNYDTGRRIDVLVNDYCEGKIRGKRVLDAGCGLGFFTEQLAQFNPGDLTAFDLSPSLVSMLAAKLPGVRVLVADILNLNGTIPEMEYDLVLSSEVIEHTPEPIMAIKSLCSRVAEGGWLAISCPNLYWKWLLNTATKLGLRPKYQGYENWISASDLRDAITSCGLKIVRAEGIHCLPWQVTPKCVLKKMDRLFQNISFGWSINHAVLARR